GAPRRAHEVRSRGCGEAPGAPGPARGGGLAAAQPRREHGRARAAAVTAHAWPAKDEPMAKLNMVKALNLALLQEMERDQDVVVIGEDVGVDGGVFRVTEDLHRKFGGKRVIDSPLAESAIIGTSVGMALYGLKPVCEIQFSGFAFQCFHQIENHAARYRMRTQGRFHCQMVVRMPYGGGVRALEHHSESEEQFYAHIPGLKMVIPSGPRNARGLLVAALRDPDPVIFFEHKALYHAAKEDVPDEIEALPLGHADVVREGRDLTIIGYGAMVRVAREAAGTRARQDAGACWPRRGRRSPTDHVVRGAAVLAVLGLLTTAAPSRSDPAPRLRVVTFNLFHGGPTSGLWGDDRRLEERLALALRELRALDPDVVALQEASAGWSRGNVAARLAAGLGFHYVFAPATPRVLPVLGRLATWV